MKEKVVSGNIGDKFSVSFPNAFSLFMIDERDSINILTLAETVICEDLSLDAVYLFCDIRDLKIFA